MAKKNNKKILQKGFTLVEVIISVGIIGFTIFSIYSSLSGVMKVGSDAKQRTGAIALANEKMEVMRNLSYEEIGVVGGIVNGPMIAEESIIKNGSTYQVDIDVRYVDDSFDGVFPADVVNTDYKQVQVQVTWRNGGNEKMITFFSNFVPNGIETNEGGGTLAINTVTSGGVLVPDVTITVESLDNSPSISYETTTDAQGNLILPGVPSQNYRFYASKSGYEDLQSYPNPPESTFIPIEKDLYVSEGVINPFTFIIEETANLKLVANNVADDSFIEGISFETSGGRKIGTSPDTFNFNETDLTNSSGEINYSSLSPSSYRIVNYDSLGNDTFSCIGADSSSVFQLSSGISSEINFIFADKEVDSFFLSVVDSLVGEPVIGATVHLSGGSFDQTLVSGERGQVFFPAKTDPVTIMDSGNYNLSISADGYQSFSEEVSINDLVTHGVVLTVE